MLELRSIHAGYGTFPALFDVSLEVRHGEAVGVIGPNGAGKTTLMRVISGLIRPTSGSLAMEEVDLLATPAHRIVELGSALQLLTKFLELDGHLLDGLVTLIRILSQTSPHNPLQIVRGERI